MLPFLRKITRVLLLREDSNQSLQEERHGEWEERAVRTLVAPRVQLKLKRSRWKWGGLSTILHSTDDWPARK